MDEQELNRKLAEWAGFTSKMEWYHGGLRFPSYEYREWTAPNSNCKKLPNFTESLDACFKWLVPNLLHYHLQRVQHTDAPSHYARVQLRLGQLREAYAETPALALCLAIEKLMEVNNGKGD